MDKNLYKKSLDYHSTPPYGKINIVPTKPLSNQLDLSLAYSPGVAAPCEEIAKNPSTVDLYTNRKNCVAVISNGTAVLGLGNIGPLASKPVMEGKAVLFKKFAGIDAIDIEISENNPQKLVEIITSLEPTFGAINLEDIKAPECFYIEQKLKENLKIPVFHDDQHGTAIIVAAAVKNALIIINKKLSEVKLVACGAGAASIACLDLLVSMGLKKGNIVVYDSQGVIDFKRKGLNTEKAKYATKNSYPSLNDALLGADIFLGVSTGDTLQPDMLNGMSRDPIVMALANPYPEIDPKLAHAIRSDIIMCTGRSDYPNQVNNVLCFPFIFRATLDVGASTINDAMKVACVNAIADLAKIETSDIVASAYANNELSFGPQYLLPKPFDPRLMLYIAPAVAKAAMDSGIAKNPIKDWDLYNYQLRKYIYRSTLAMKNIFSKAKLSRKKIAYTDGENDKILRAAQTIVDERLGYPILIGKKNTINHKIKNLKLRMKESLDYSIINAEEKNNINIASEMLQSGEIDCMLCGIEQEYNQVLNTINSALGNSATLSSITAVNSEKGLYFIGDGYVNHDPSANDISQMIFHAAEKISLFGLEPKFALLSHSNFGSSNHHTAQKMREVFNILKKNNPNISYDGEMQGDSAINEIVRKAHHDNTKLDGSANVLIMPNIDSANIAINLIKHLANAQTVGPILLGLKYSAHILLPSMTVRGIVNMSAFALADA